MKTDKELLQLAAKAAGYKFNLDTHSGEVRVLFKDRWPIWVPLDDDGQAFRLAVDLGFYVQICDLFNATVIEIKRITVCENHDKDKHAAQLCVQQRLLGRVCNEINTQVQA